jgi:hypothetical protein
LSTPLAFILPPLLAASIKPYSAFKFSFYRRLRYLKSRRFCLF